MKRTLQIIVMLLLAFFMLPATLQAQDSFWCGGDLTNLLDPNQADDLQAALNQAKTTVQWGMFRLGMRNIAETPLTGVVKYDPDKAWDGYTLLATMGGYVDPNTGVNNPAILIDMEGNIINAWPLTSTPSKLLPGGNIIGRFRTRTRS